MNGRENFEPTTEMSSNLQETNEMLRELFENMGSCLAVYEAVDDGNDFIFKEFNRAAERADKIDRKRVIGKSVLEVFPGVKEFGLFEVFQRVFKTGKPEKFPLKQYKDGRIWGWRENYVFKLSSGEVVAIYEDFTQQKVAEEKIKHLNGVLRAIRNVNQLIAREKDRDKLVQKVCNKLVESQSYHVVWCIVFDESGKVDAFAQQHVGEKLFADLVERIRKGKLPYCCQKALSQPDAVFVDKMLDECDDCPLKQLHSPKRVLTCRMECGGKVFGLLSATIPMDIPFEPEEKSLFKEVAGDIALTLQNLELENELKKSKEDLEEAQKVAHIGSWCYCVAEDELRWSDEIYRIFGLEKENFDRTYESFMKIVHPGDRQMVENAYKDSLENAKPYELVHRIIRPDGKVRYVREKVSIVKDDSGRVIETIGTVQDITEKWLAQKKLKLLSAAAEQASEMIVITSPDGTIEYVNPAFGKITGYSTKEAIGKTPRILKSGEQDQEFYRELWETITGKKQWTGHFINKKKDNTLYEEEALIFPLISSEGEITNFTKIARDVTREVQLERQFMQSQKMEAVGRLAGGIAHDFNNMLTGISVSAEFARSELKPENPAMEYIADISKTARRAADLVKKLLAISKKQVASPIVIDVNEEIKSMERVIRRIIGEDVEFKMILPPEVLPIKIDPSQLNQIILNMAVNARDAMPRGGKFIIKAEVVKSEQINRFNNSTIEPEKFVALEFSDTGTGIDKETLPHIFEPFFSTRKSEKRSGLGLSTVYGIVKQAGGYISVDSEPGKRTTFYLYFPFSKEKIRVKRETPKPSLQVIEGNESVLVVDDDEVILKLLKKALSKAGYEVHCAKSGSEAREILSGLDHEPSLLISDIILPDTNGVELAENIKENVLDIRTIFISGYVEDYLNQLTQFGRDIDFIPKPFDLNTILNKVREFFDR